jgi:hypothetical protein
MAAHWLRGGMLALSAGSLLLPLLLLVPRRWAALAMQLALVIAAAEWTRTGLHLAMVRLQNRDDWLRGTLILLGVAAFNLFAAALYRTTTLRRRYRAAGVAQ